jgi:hypothetical protein
LQHFRKLASFSVGVAGGTVYFLVIIFLKRPNFDQDYRYITAAVDMTERDRTLWINIRTFSPLTTMAGEEEVLRCNFFP